MSGHQTATIEDTVYFWFAANDTSGSGGDGATPLYDVREAGAAAGAIPLLSGTPTLLSHANFPPGCHEIAVAATTGNGFAADDTFSVFCTLAIDSQNPSGFVGSCTLTPLAKDGTVLKPTTAGRTLDVTAGGEAGLDLDNTSGTWAAAQFAAAFITASKFGANAIDAAALATTAVEEIRNAITGGAYALDTDANGAIRIVDGTGARELNTNLGAIALVDVCTANSDMRGTDDAALAALVTAARMGALDDWLNGGRLDLILDIIAADTTTDIPALIAALENISEANVLTQMNASLDTNIPELGVGVPSATPTIRTGLMFLYMGLRNKRDTTSTSDEIHNDAGTVIASAVLSDDTVTYISGEYS